MERLLCGLVIRLVLGDLCDREVGAIVNAANDHLWMGGGVAGAIKRRGGVTIEQEAVRRGPIPVGAAVATGAGALAAKYVIHAAVMGQDLTTSAEAIRRATGSALQAAARLGLTSIAFPALGTGVGGFPLGECARLMLAEVAGQTASRGTLSCVEFVLFDGTAYGAFADALQTLPEMEGCHGGGN